MQPTTPGTTEIEEYDRLYNQYLQSLTNAGTQPPPPFYPIYQSTMTAGINWPQSVAAAVAGMPQFYPNINNPQAAQQSHQPCPQHPALQPPQLVSGHSQPPQSQPMLQLPAKTLLKGRSHPTNNNTANDNNSETNRHGLGQPACATVNMTVSTPMNPQESELMSELQRAGCRDPTEILDAIRHLHQKKVDSLDKNGDCGDGYDDEEREDSYPTADEVLVHIVTLRENLFDAQQLDQARVMSERSNEQERALRKKIHTDLFNRVLMESSLDTLSTGHFAKSWLLKQQTAFDKFQEFAKIGSDTKRVLIEILKLERKSRSWYQNLPETYFSIVLVDHLMETSSSEQLKEVLQVQLDSLKHSIFYLSRKLLLVNCLLWIDAAVPQKQNFVMMCTEQCAGVPHIFTKANDLYKKDNDNDGEIVVMSSNDKNCLKRESTIHVIDLCGTTDSNDKEASAKISFKRIKSDPLQD